MQSLVPPTSEERLRTIFVNKIPSGIGGEDQVQKLFSVVGRMRRWDSGLSHKSEHKGMLFGFAQYEDVESLSAAVDLLKEIEVPVKKQPLAENQPTAEEADEAIKKVDKVKLQMTIDESTGRYLAWWKENSAGDPAIAGRLDETREALRQFVRGLFYPSVQAGRDPDGDISMGDGANGTGDNAEVVNIPLAQEDELADIPPEMRETVAGEIAAFRDRSNQRDMERLRQEQEHEERERQRNGAPRISQLGSPQPGNSNMIPLGPRALTNVPSGPRGNRAIEFVNGGTTNGHTFEDEDDTDASDEELHRRELAKEKAEEDRKFQEALKKWRTRERARDAALKREREREREEEEETARRAAETLEYLANFDDTQESHRQNHPYYRDRPTWVTNRNTERNAQEAWDEEDRRAEQEELRKAAAEMEQARGMADSFLERQAEEMETKPTAPTGPSAGPQPFTISLGAAAQRAQARTAPARRTVAEVEGLLDDEEQEQATKRQLVPIKFEPITDAKAMTDEDIQNAVRALAQEIPIDRDGLWAWDVKWDYLEDSVIREKLRPFVEKKVVEYVGVVDQFLLGVVEEHLRKHGKPAELVETLHEVMDEDAEDMVKKLWRMVIFFTESEKRGLPA